MDYILSHWQPLLLALGIGFGLGRLTAKDPITRERERKAHDAAVRKWKAEMKPELATAVRDPGSQIRCET